MLEADLVAFLKTVVVKDNLIPLAAYESAADKFSVTFTKIEEIALVNGFYPMRYQRQRNLIRGRGQLQLLKSRVAVVGCGGLGGHIFEMLVRLGVGNLVVIDPDFFVESNLNRQLLATVATLGRYKVEVARERGEMINPVVAVEVLSQSFQSDRGAQLLSSCDLVFDALDSIPLRLQLADLCSSFEIVLIHGAVAGWYGQVAPVPPASGIMGQIYQNSGLESQNGRVAEEGGNLAPTVNLVAALEVATGLPYLLDDYQKKWSPGCFVDLLVPELELWS